MFQFKLHCNNTLTIEPNPVVYHYWLVIWRFTLIIKPSEYLSHVAYSRELFKTLELLNAFDKCNTTY